MKEHPRPILLEFKTFRMRGHEEASGTKYVPSVLMEASADKNPVENYRNYLKENNILSDDFDAFSMPKSRRRSTKIGLLPMPNPKLTPTYEMS